MVRLTARSRQNILDEPDLGFALLGDLQAPFQGLLGLFEPLTDEPRLASAPSSCPARALPPAQRTCSVFVRRSSNRWSSVTCPFGSAATCCPLAKSKPACHGCRQ